MPTEEQARHDQFCPHPTIIRDAFAARGLVAEARQQQLNRRSTPHNSESVAITCAECIHDECPLREFGLEFNRGCSEGRRK